MQGIKIGSDKIIGPGIGLGLEMNNKHSDQQSIYCPSLVELNGDRRRRRFEHINLQISIQTFYHVTEDCRDRSILLLLQVAFFLGVHRGTTNI